MDYHQKLFFNVFKTLEALNIKDYYNLTRKIIKMGILSDKDSAHLATMFMNAAFSCDKKSKEIDPMFAKLLDLSIKYSKE